MRLCSVKRLKVEEEAAGLEGVTEENQGGFSAQLKKRFQGQRVLISLKHC